MGLQEQIKQARELPGNLRMPGLTRPAEEAIEAVCNAAELVLLFERAEEREFDVELRNGGGQKGRYIASVFGGPMIERPGYSYSAEEEAQADTPTDALKKALFAAEEAGNA